MFPECSGAGRFEPVPQGRIAETARRSTRPEATGRDTKKNFLMGDFSIDMQLSNSYMHAVPSGTMAINAHVISGSDPGAVPGGSTRNLLRWGRMRGRNRIDERVKVFAFARCGTAVIGPQSTVANDNRAPVALAA